MKLKILSWNIWINGYFDHVTDFLKASGADIIGLQEVVSDEPKRDIISFFTKLGYQHVFAPVKKTRNVPGVMANINGVFARRGINIDGQLLIGHTLQMLSRN